MSKKRVLEEASRDIREVYTVDRKLGQGAFGMVYLVHEKLPDGGKGAALACKALAKSKLALPEHEEDVRKEVRIMKMLADQRNVVQIVEAFEDRANVYIVMELCSGGELFDRIIAKGHYSEADAAALIRTMLTVVSACHRNGIIHRDLKPENFLLDGPGDDAELKATDFGLSCFAKPGERCTEQVGTPVYVAPEILRGEYNHKSDIWSLGVILYILLSGRPPFFGKTDRDELRATLRGVYDLTHSPWPDISDDAKEVVQMMMCMDVMRRPEADELLQHRWVKKHGVASTAPLVASVRASMQEFAHMNKFKKRALQFMAGNLSAAEMDMMQKMFVKMDVDGSGTISVEEFRNAMSTTGNDFTEQEIRDLIAAYDVDDNGSIDYSEFCTAMTNLNRLKTVDNLEAAFSKFDVDGDGTITVNEVMEALKDVPNITREEAERLVREADLNGDGMIDYEEFVSMMVAKDDKLREATHMQKGRISTAGLDGDT